MCPYSKTRQLHKQVKKPSLDQLIVYLSILPLSTILSSNICWAGLTDNHSLSTLPFIFKQSIIPTHDMDHIALVVYIDYHRKPLPYTWLILSICPFVSGKSDASSSQNVPNNNNFYHSQTSKNSNKNTLKNRITKYYKRCRRTMRSAFLRLRRWVSEHHGVLVWHCYCILPFCMYTDISAAYMFPCVRIYCTVYLGS